jgi:hypothetical protein
MISIQEKFETLSSTIKKPEIRADQRQSVLAPQDEINESFRRARALEELGKTRGNSKKIKESDVYLQCDKNIDTNVD